MRVPLVTPLAAPYRGARVSDGGIVAEWPIGRARSQETQVNLIFWGTACIVSEDMLHDLHDKEGEEGSSTRATRARSRS